MDDKLRSSRREFIEGALAAGAAFAFAGLVRGEETPGSSTPLATQRIAQPDNAMCSWVGFSPVNDQVAFTSGMIDKANLYVSRVGQPQEFDVLWEPTTDTAGIQACAWSPDGGEVAFLVKYGNKETTPKFFKISICVVNVSSGVVREPVIIKETVGEEVVQRANVSYQKGLSWRGNSHICIPANDGGIMKFDSHTGQSETLVAAQSGMTVSSVALTPSGELRFVRVRGLEPGSGGEFVLCGLTQDGTICDYGNLTQQLGQIFNARLSQNGDFVFVEKRENSDSTNLIYKIETHSVVGQIPAVVFHQKDMYAYVPVTMRSETELILIEMVSLTLADGSMGAPQTRAAKLTIS
jgi:hypothetical protein